MGRFFALMEATFRTHGYEVCLDAALEGRSGTVYKVPLLAEKDGQAILVDARLAEEIVDASAVDDVQEVVRDTGADLGVVCHIEEASPDAHAGNGGSVVLWGRDVLSRLVGEAALAEATGIAPGALPLEDADGPEPLLAESIDDLLPDAFRSDDLTGRLRNAVEAGLAAQEDTAAAGAPCVLEGQEAPTTFARDVEDLLAGAASGEGTPLPQEEPVLSLPVAREPSEADPPGPTVPDGPAPTETAASAPAPEPAAAPGLPAFEHPLLPVLVPLEDALRRTKDRLFRHARTELILHPVYLIDYECDLLTEGSLRYETERGRIQVDGTRPDVGAVDPLYIDPDVPSRLDGLDGLGFAERRLRIEEASAQRLAMEWIATQHTRLVEVQVQDEDQSFAYTEKRKVQPRPEHIRLELKGVYHRPVWRVVGVNGFIDLDAMAGHQVDENLRNPNPDVLMMD